MSVSVGPAGGRFAVPALALGAALAAALFAGQVVAAWPAPGDALARLILTDSVLPRGAVAGLAGATLGLSGALLQRVLRNPVADPSTLGVAAGAQLAMTLATVFAPALMGVAREAVAFGGGAFMLALVLALAWRGGLEPLTVALCGMIVSLLAASMSATVILANGEYMLSLFIWGGGSLEQLGWGAARTLLWRGLLAGLLVALLLRPITLLGFDDGQARALGLNASGMRLLVLALAVLLATGVVAHVGMIGFVGLAAPHLARLSGVRRLPVLLLASAAIGAVLLLLTDGLVQLAEVGGTPFVPTGAATALLGGPVLLALLPRLTGRQRPPPAGPVAPAHRIAHPASRLCALAVLVAAVSILALLLGPGESGWTLATGPLAAELLPWRWPRILAAGAGGAMLAAAGFVLQRVSGNPLASPEVLGVSSGAGVGLAAVLLVAPGAGHAALSAGAAVGSLLAILLVAALALRGGFGPERLLLGGIAIGALAGAAVTTVIARGGPEGMRLLDWMSGSTQRTGPDEALLAALSCLAILPLFALGRWFAILPLGPGVSRALGLSATRAAGLLVLLAAILSASATLSVGPLSFVGLMAPHMARLAGFARPAAQLAASLLIGVLLMVFADWMARTLAFPYQLPLGLFASLVGAPYLVILLNAAAPGRR